MGKRGADETMHAVNVELDETISEGEPIRLCALRNVFNFNLTIGEGELWITEIKKETKHQIFKLDRFTILLLVE